MANALLACPDPIGYEKSAADLVKDVREYFDLRIVPYTRPTASGDRISAGKIDSRAVVELGTPR